MEMMGMVFRSGPPTRSRPCSFFRHFRPSLRFRVAAEYGHPILYPVRGEFESRDDVRCIAKATSGPARTAPGRDGPAVNPSDWNSRISHRREASDRRRRTNPQCPHPLSNHRPSIGGLTQTAEVEPGSLANVKVW
jgi:hypothetical protein